MVAPAPRACITCGTKLGKSNRSGYCRAHFARALHDNPEAARRKIERMVASFASSPRRQEHHARLAQASRSRMAWCPLEYRGLYRELTRRRDFMASEARAIVVAQVARDQCAALTRPETLRIG